MPTRTITLAFAAIPASVTGLSQSRSMSSISSGMECVWNLLTAFALLSTRSAFSSCSCSALTVFRSNVWTGREILRRPIGFMFRTVDVHNANFSDFFVTKLSICRAYNGHALPTKLRAVGSQQTAKTIAEVPRRTDRPSNPMVWRRRSDDN